METEQRLLSSMCVGSHSRGRLPSRRGGCPDISRISNVQHLRLSLDVGHAGLRAIKINLGATLLQKSWTISKLFQRMFVVVLS
jgi:hypothetical protein